MPLRLRLSLMLGILLLLCALGAGATQFLLSRATGSFSEGQAAANRLARVLQMEIDLTAARNQINIWLQRANPDMVRGADRFLGELDRGAASLTAEPTLSAEQRQHLEAFGAARTGYLESWRQMQGIVAERLRAEADQNAAGDRLTAALATVPAGQSEAVSGVLAQARIAGLRLRADGGAEHRTAAEAAIQATRAALQAAGLSPETAIGRAFHDWADGLGRSIAILPTYTALRATFRDQGNAMSAAIAALRQIEQGTAQASTQAASESLVMTSRTGIAASILVVLGGILCIVALIRMIVAPLRGITGAMGTIAAGRLDTSIPGIERRDELGQMAQALAVFRDAQAENQALRARQEQDRETSEAQRRAALLAMADHVEREAGTAVAGVRADAQGMADTVADLTRAMQAAAAQGNAAGVIAGRALENAQAIASATEQLSASVREISGRLSAANTTTRRVAERGTASRAVIAGLSEGVGRIGEVVRMISDIAARTNLLALNATIESARAGEAGKGFAVVASEVKQLAAQTARATEEVATNIQQISAATRSAVEAVQEMADSIGEIDHMATSIAGALEQQSSATREIAARVAEATQGVREVGDSLAAMNETSEDTAAQAEQMQRRAAATRDSVEQLGGSLVRIVRAATG